MLDIKLIRDKPELVKIGIEKKGSNPALVDKILELDVKKRELLTTSETLRAEQKRLDFTNELARAQGKALKEQIDSLENQLKTIETDLMILLGQLPNIPADDVPVGTDESHNVVLKQVGSPRNFDFEIKDHVELGKQLGLIDSEKAGQISGSRFAYIKGKLVLLEFAIIQFALNVLTDSDRLAAIASEASLSVSSKPFIPIIPPVFIRPEIFDRMARLEPREERYHIPSDDLYLIGSAEHTLGPLHMDEIINEADLPIRYVGFSTAFRREAGSYGKDTKGILRLHQFDKLEMESFTLSEESKKEQDFIVAIQEHLLQALDLPYQIVGICTGDMGDPDARQIDIETWMPGQNQYRETHTADLMTDYQARRLNTRVRRKKNETEFVHMNDATTFAIGRMLIAILENGQQADGSITVPSALVPYCGFSTITA